ncbi:hypothetical protein M0R45_011086 [Rubus argutus]|uniref:Uncharacterized protein n=1 Tax=Rubus argutus TaxID=59490 RepID=A0AAW1Y8Z3_RUBAR
MILSGKIQRQVTTTHHTIQCFSKFITLFVVLLCFCIVIGHLLEKSRWMTESVTALFIGLCTGIFIL